MTVPRSTAPIDPLLAAPLVGRVWWAIVLRGVVGVLFGVMTFVWPGITLSVLLIYFAIYALFDGVLALVAAFRAPRGHLKVWPFVLEGVAGIAAGIIALTMPGLTALVLEYLFAGWLLITGILEIVGAVRLRDHISDEWWLILAGVLSILAGIGMYAFPLLGIASLVLLIGAYALAFGIVLIFLGLRIKGWSQHAAATV
jgi:uncharacterized membrane protein HdeD (DUF308 family)